MKPHLRVYFLKQAVIYIKCKNHYEEKTFYSVFYTTSSISGEIADEVKLLCPYFCGSCPLL